MIIIVRNFIDLRMLDIGLSALLDNKEMLKAGKELGYEESVNYLRDQVFEIRKMVLDEVLSSDYYNED